MTASLSGKVAIATGGASGLGRGIVEKFVAEGDSGLIASVWTDALTHSRGCVRHVQSDRVARRSAPALEGARSATVSNGQVEMEPNMDDTAALVEIEAIKQLKARYCLLLDSRQWQQWHQLFTDDLVSYTSAAGGAGHCHPVRRRALLTSLRSIIHPSELE